MRLLSHDPVWTKIVERSRAARLPRPSTLQRILHKARQSGGGSVGPVNLEHGPVCQVQDVPRPQERDPRGGQHEVIGGSRPRVEVHAAHVGNALQGGDQKSHSAEVGVGTQGGGFVEKTESVAQCCAALSPDAQIAGEAKPSDLSDVAWDGYGNAADVFSFHDNGVATRRGWDTCRDVKYGRQKRIVRPICSNANPIATDVANFGCI